MAEPDENAAPGNGTSPRPPRPARRRGLATYVVAVDETTGLAVKIERLDEQTGARRELSLEEYASAYAFAGYAAPFYAAYAATLVDPYDHPAMRAYYKGLADYTRALIGR